MRLVFVASGLALSGCAASGGGSGGGSAAAATVQPEGQLLGMPAAFTASDQPGLQFRAASFGDWTPGYGAPRFERIPIDVFGDVPPPEDGGSPFLAISFGLDSVYVSPKLLPVNTVVDGSPLGSALQAAVLNLSTSAMHSWTAWAFTVDSAFVLDTTNLSAAVKSTMAAGEADRSIFGYTMETYPAVPFDTATSTVVVDAAMLGLSPSQQLFALDLHGALYGTDLGGGAMFNTRPLPSEPVLYFTLRPEYVARPEVASGLQSRWGLGSPPTAGTIFRTQYRTAIGQWTDTKVYRTWAELGLGENPGVLDGLAVDAAPGASGQDTFDEIVISRQVAPAEDQVTYIRIAPSEPAVPRRVVVFGNPPGRYRSLGRVFGAGRGVGDFCVADPDPFVHVGPSVPAVLDDYFVARRLEPVATSATGPIAPGEPRLSASGFRDKANGRPAMRTVMSEPEAKVHTGTARLLWGRTTGPLSSLGPIDWEAPIDIPYAGRPLSADRELPPLGVTGDQWDVAQWTLHVGGRVLYAPLVVLRR